MENTAATKTCRSAQERITLSSEASLRVTSWLEELQSSIPGIRISKSDLVDWLIKSHSEALAAREVTSIKEAFFDEVSFTEWALRTIKEARARGEKLSLADLVSGRTSLTLEQARTRRPRKKNHESPDASVADKMPGLTKEVSIAESVS